MRKSVVQPAWRAVPKSAQMFGVATTEVLRCADILRRREARLTTEWLLYVGPYLAAALHDRIVRIDASARVGTTIDIARAKHDFGEALHPASLTSGFGADDILYRIAVWSGDDSSAAVCFNCCSEDSQC